MDHGGGGVAEHVLLRHPALDTDVVGRGRQRVEVEVAADREQHPHGQLGDGPHRHAVHRQRLREAARDAAEGHVHERLRPAARPPVRAARRAAASQAGSWKRWVSGWAPSSESGKAQVGRRAQQVRRRIGREPLRLADPSIALAAIPSAELLDRGSARSPRARAGCRAARPRAPSRTRSGRAARASGRHSSHASRSRGRAAVVLSRPKISPTTTSFASSGGSSGTRAQIAPSSSSGGGSNCQNSKPGAVHRSGQVRRPRHQHLVPRALEGPRERHERVEVPGPAGGAEEDAHASSLTARAAASSGTSAGLGWRSSAPSARGPLVEPARRDGAVASRHATSPPAPRQRAAPGGSPRDHRAHRRAGFARPAPGATSAPR